MDRLEAMSIVLRTVDKGSLTAAAKTLNMPLPTLSRKLSELEAYLGTKLLQRSTRKVSLTAAGQQYVEAARRIMQEVEAAERAASGEYKTPRGELVLTAPLSFGQKYLLPIVTDFLAAYPEIDVRLLLSDHNLHLHEDHVDMALRLGPLRDSGMIATKVGSMDTLVCASPALLKEHGTPRHPRELSALPTVVFTGPATSVWTFRDPQTKQKLEAPIKPRLSVTSADAAVQAALRHTGLTRVFRYHCAEALRAGTLVQVLQRYDVEPLPVHLLHAAHGKLPLKMRVFLDFAASRLRTTLAKL